MAGLICIGRVPLSQYPARSLNFHDAVLQCETKHQDCDVQEEVESSPKQRSLHSLNFDAIGEAVKDGDEILQKALEQANQQHQWAMQVANFLLLLSLLLSLFAPECLPQHACLHIDASPFL